MLKAASGPSIGKLNVVGLVRRLKTREETCGLSSIFIGSSIVNFSCVRKVVKTSTLCSGDANRAVIFSHSGSSVLFKRRPSRERVPAFLYTDSGNVFCSLGPDRLPRVGCFVSRNLIGGRIVKGGSLSSLSNSTGPILLCCRCGSWSDVGEVNCRWLLSYVSYYDSALGGNAVDVLFSFCPLGSRLRLARYCLRFVTGGVR